MSRVPDRVLGNYLLRSVIGKGGTSEVYAAEHQLLGTPVAIKLLREELAQDDATAAALIEEATRTRDIVHPNIIRVHDVGRDGESGRCYLVMDRIDGDSLAARLRAQGPLPEATVHALAIALADAMQAAHARGVIHRDLKPGNIMLRGDTPTIIDFGISKYLGSQASTVTSRRIGTLAYMAPEQLAGGVISPAVDVWALGVILYEAVTGRLPYDNFADGRWPQLFDAVPPASSLASVSPTFERILERCLAREVADRYPSMAALAADLRGGGDERITAPVAEPPITVLPVRAARRRMPLAIVGVALVVGIVIAAMALQSTDEPPPPPVVTEEPTPMPVAAPASPPSQAPVTEVRPTEPERVSPPRASVKRPAKRRAPVAPARTPPRETLD